ncbi:zf-HC2 domain-containing protein [Streptomyces sp. Amel2xB2]|uniref:zf-HC2 domain-containing protein n=1 Tax=Streptomyces sp. Amel2xB2 TaxID=1305829 RepID=UPI0021ABB7B4|nr:zf-HC2 domain-containing protein [Streptomyces sp. Amel2xB2]
MPFPPTVLVAGTGIAGIGDAAIGEDGDMHCSRARTALSARLDQEALPPGVTESRLAEHLASCPDCRRWQTQAERLRHLSAGGHAPSAKPDPEPESATETETGTDGGGYAEGHAHRHGSGERGRNRRGRHAC